MGDMKNIKGTSSPFVGMQDGYKSLKKSDFIHVHFVIDFVAIHNWSKDNLAAKWVGAKLSAGSNVTGSNSNE